MENNLEKMINADTEYLLDLIEDITERLEKVEATHTER